MGYELGQILYRATVHPGAGWLRATPDASPPAEDPRIWYEEFVVVKVTAKGAWVTRRLDNMSMFQDTSSVRRWVPIDGKFCSASKQDALSRLRARTRSYVKHARRRLKDAEARAAVLGLTVPDRESFSRSLWDSDY